MKTCVVCGAKFSSRIKKADRCKVCWARALEPGGLEQAFNTCVTCGCAIGEGKKCLDCGLDDIPF